MATSPVQSRRWKGVVLRLLLVLVGISCPFLSLRLVFTLFPDLSPEGKALFVDFKTGGERTIFTTYDGDAFRHQLGSVRPPAENTVLEDVLRYYDDDGFREPALTADHYPIIALGDSFTEGGENPWVDVLAQSLDIPVRNLGWRGFGPLEEAKVMAAFGGDDLEWVLIAYFEGNDLSNVQTSFASGDINIDRHRGEVASDQAAFEPVLNPEDAYVYPLQHQVGENTYDIAYISDYLWWLNGSEDVYRRSQNIARMREAFQNIKNLAGDAQVALIYIPTKEHIYFPYSAAAGNRVFVLQNGFALQLDAEDWLRFPDTYIPQNADEVQANLDHQRNVVQEVAAELGVHFIDLTPVFESTAAAGALLYYPYDSHWNQQGHDLAGRTIADYIGQAR